MSTAELKNNLHRLIVETDDTDILMKAQDVLSASVNGSSKLSDYEIERIEKGLKDIEEGKVYSHKEVRAEIDEWITKNS